MPALKGRSLSFAWGGAAVAGVREKSFELNGAEIDVSGDDSNGVRVLLDVSAQDEVNISLSGVSKTNDLKTDWFGGNRTKTSTFTYPDGTVITGMFYMASYKETGSYNDAVTFEASFLSSGTVSYTAGP